MIPRVQAFFDKDSSTLTYLVSDPATGDAVIIDPVLDYDVFASQTSSSGADLILDAIVAQGLHVRASLETHAHADHLSASHYLKEKLGIPVGIGRDITLIQETFQQVFNLPKVAKTDGSQFDLLLEPGQTSRFGSLELLPLPTPGHTPACLSYRIGDAVFTGDALFMEDYGTGRTDFPLGSARALYHSVHDVLYALPNATRVFVGHDYQPGGRRVRYESTIERQRSSNVQLRSGTELEDFVRFRDARDKTLRAPRLIYQSVQMNAFGGLLPEPEEGGGRFFKIPLNRRIKTTSGGTPLS